jgi:hypothetical protein
LQTLKPGKGLPIFLIIFMNRFTIIITAILILTSAGCVYATNGLAFLKVCPDARSSAIGEALTYDQKYNFFHHPAALALIDKRGLALNHSLWILDTEINYLEVHFPGYLNVSFHLLSTGVEDIEVRTTPSPQPVSYVDSRDLALGLTLARSINPHLHLGVSFNFIHEHILNEDTEGLACDLGAIYKLNDRIYGNFSLNHIGQMSAMLSQRPQLPLTAVTGLNYLIPYSSHASILFSAGLNFVREEELRGNLGCEWKPIKEIALRSGYLVNYDERGLTAGLGLKWKGWGLDYAYIPFGSDLGEVEKFSLFFEF